MYPIYTKKSIPIEELVAKPTVPLLYSSSRLRLLTSRMNTNWLETLTGPPILLTVVEVAASASLQICLTAQASPTWAVMWTLSAFHGKWALSDFLLRTLICSLLTWWVCSFRADQKEFSTFLEKHWPFKYPLWTLKHHQVENEGHSAAISATKHSLRRTAL